MMLTKRLQIVGKDFVNAYRLMSLRTYFSSWIVYLLYIHIRVNIQLAAVADHDSNCCR